MIFLFYIVAALQIFLSYKSWRSGIAYYNYFRNAAANPLPEYSPFASIIAPCKGVDQGFELNLNALLTQEYPTYEVIFVVDDENDPAVSVIDQILVKFKSKARLVVAEKSTISGQKVANLQEAVRHVNAASEIFAFVDSDARPAKDWLRQLVAPLGDNKIGATTGYRWFLSPKATLAGELLSTWNASIASALGPNASSNFCWGGSMALRRKTFEKLDIREKWKGTLSDDFVVTRAISDAALAITFVPRALTASVEDCTFRDLFEFTTRQMKITRVYAPKFWAISLIGSVVFDLTMILAIVYFCFGDDIPCFAALSTLLLVVVFGSAKSWLRLSAVKLVLNDYSPILKRQTFSQMILWPFSPTIFLLNCLAGIFSRTIIWRGTRYEMLSPHETRISTRP